MIETEAGIKEEVKTKTCFVIMPIANVPGYTDGHFNRVYEHIIKPACIEAGFEPIRADDVKSTNDIVIDIIRKIVQSDMAICDLSARNPNVLYELGIRHSFGLPVTLIKDTETPRTFDIQGIRDTSYESDLRIDNVQMAIQNIAEAIKATYNAPSHEENSILHALKIQPAKVTGQLDLSEESSIILEAIEGLGRRIERVEKNSNNNLHDQLVTFVENKHDKDKSKFFFFNSYEEQNGLKVKNEKISNQQIKAGRHVNKDT